MKAVRVKPRCGRALPLDRSTPIATAYPLNVAPGSATKHTGLRFRNENLFTYEATLRSDRRAALQPFRAIEAGEGGGARTRQPHGAAPVLARLEPST